MRFFIERKHFFLFKFIMECDFMINSIYFGGQPGPVQNDSPIPCTGNETVLLIQDNVPWCSHPTQDPLGANVTELIAQGKNFCIINSSDIGSTNLLKFDEIIISAAQTQTFYDNLFPGGLIHQAIVDFVDQGGILSANLTDYASGPGAGGNWFSYTFIGGVKHVFMEDQNNSIADPSHPIITGILPCPSGNCGQIVDIAARNDLDSWNYSSHGYFIYLPTGTNIIITDSNDYPVMVEYPFGNGIVIATLTTTEWRYAGCFGYWPPHKELLANEIAYQDYIVKIKVPVDIKPGSCPNPLNVKSRGVLPVAILGTDTFDVTQVDITTIELEGVKPIHSSLEDVATPFEPFIGKNEASDCNSDGPDGFLDLTLKFDTQEIVAALGSVTDGEVRALTLTAKLKPEFGGRSIIGEDVVVILDKTK